MQCHDQKGGSRHQRRTWKMVTVSLPVQSWMVTCST